MTQPAPGDPRYRELDDKIMQAIQERPLTSEEITARAGSNDKTVRKRLKILPVTRIPDKRRVLYSPACRTPPDPGDGNAPGGLPVSASSKTPDQDNAELPGTHAGPGPEIPLCSAKTRQKPDSKLDSDLTKNNLTTGRSGSAYVLEVLKAEPTRMIPVGEVSQKTGIKKDTVNQYCSRLKKEGKLRRPVKGFYQYNPLCEEGNLKDLARSGDLKIENLVFVRNNPRGPTGQTTKPVPPDPNLTIEPDSIGQEPNSDLIEPDPRIPEPLPGYPQNLVTGQEVFCGKYCRTGTEIIRISANGAPPMSLDTGLILIDHLGIDETWKCVSIELNVDSYKHRIDFSYSLQTIKGLLLKAYQHGYNTRLEIANRREVSIGEVVELFHALAGRIDGKEALRKTEALEARVKQNEKDTRLALNIARRVRDREPQGTSTGKAHKKQEPPATFTTGKIIKQEQAPAAVREESVS